MLVPRGRSKKVELIDHLRDVNPHYQPFEDGVVQDIVDGHPNQLHHILVAGESASSKGEFSRQFGMALRRRPEVKDWLRDHRMKRLCLYHAAIGRTQQDLATEVGILPVVSGTIPRGRIDPVRYANTSTLMEHMSSLADRNLDGVFFDDSIWDTAIYNKRGKVIGVQRGSLRWAQNVLTQKRGRAVFLHTDESVKQEELQRRQQLREATSVSEAVSILESYGINSDNPEEAMITARKSGTAGSVAHTRRTLIQLMHNEINNGDMPFDEYQGLNIEQFRNLLRLEPARWNTLLKRWDILWGNVMAGKPRDSFELLTDRVVIFDNPRLRKETRRNRYTQVLEPVEIGLSKAAQGSQSWVLRSEVRSLGIKLP